MEQPKMPRWPLEGQASTPLLRILLRELRQERPSPPELVLTVTLPPPSEGGAAFFDDDL
jgi:hypothetical protein